MNREILLHDECIALATKYGQLGLLEHAETLHRRQLHVHGKPRALTLVKAHFFAPAAGETGVIFAFGGQTDPQLQGLEGVQLTFQPNEATEAHAALLVELAGYDQRFLDEELAERSAGECA